MFRPFAFLAALLTLFGIAGPVQALDAIQSTVVSGRAPTTLCTTAPGGLGINRADGTLSICDPSKTARTFSLIDVAPAASRYGTDAYASGRSTGWAGLAIVNSDNSTTSGAERYALVGGYVGSGTGDPSVIGTSFGVGAYATKKDWYQSTVAGQMVGANIVVRNGYFGADANSTMPSHPEFNGYNPAGDASGIVINSVQASPYGQNAAMEASIHFAQGGVFSAAGGLHSMNVQLGAMRMLTPQGTSANPGVGVAVSANAGTLDYAFQATNAAGAGRYQYAPGIWTGFLRYNLDDGTHAPYDALRADQDGSLMFGASNGTKKRIRAATNGTFQFLNNAEQVVTQIDEAGTIYLGGGVVIQGAQVLGGQQPAISSSLSDTAKIAAILATLRAHGLIAQ